MSDEKKIYVVLYSPDGVPQTTDGDWAGIIGAYKTLEKAEKMARLARNSGTWGDFSRTNESHPDYDPDKTSSNREIFIEVEAVQLV